MSEGNLEVTVRSQEVRVGDASSNVLIDFKNNTDADLTFTFYLTIPTALVAQDKVNDIVFKGFTTTPDSQPSDGTGTTWRIGERKGTSIKKGAPITLTLANIVATSAGTPEIEIEWRSGSTKVDSVALGITVLAADDFPRIFSFGAEEYVVTKRITKPEIHLKWKTDNKSVVELFRLGKKVLPTAGQDSASHDQPEWWPDSKYDDSAGLQPYELRATANGKTVSRWLFVRIQEPGWNKVECSQGCPTLLLNDGNNQLYGVFTRGGEGALYKLDVESGALGRGDSRCCAVPQGMEQSPGAFFNERVWLVGGSQINPNRCSNRVWWFDPRKKGFGDLTAQWGSPRMGHACVEFDSKIWVLGGVDNNGNALDEVWVCDGKTWERSTPLPKPLCLLAAAEFDNKLWIYGGVDAAFGVPQRNLWFRTAGGTTWTQVKFWGEVHDQPSSDPGFGDPFGSALCIGRHEQADALCCLGTFQTRKIESRMFTLSLGDYAADIHGNDPIPSGKSWPTTWSLAGQAGQQQAFRLSAVRFNNFIFVVPLVWGADNPTLTYLVQ